MFPKPCLAKVPGLPPRESGNQPIKGRATNAHNIDFTGILSVEGLSLPSLGTVRVLARGQGEQYQGQGLLSWVTSVSHYLSLVLPVLSIR